MFGNRLGIGIDCDDNVWRIVALRATGAGYEVTEAAALSLDQERPDEATASLEALLRANGGARQRIAMALPASGCAFKTASLPAGKLVDLLQVIQFEAEHQFPLPLQELSWGFMLAPEPSGRQHAVIAGARLSLVDEHLELLREAHAVPFALLPAPLAASAAIARPDGVYIVVFAGTLWSDLCLYADDRLLACRSIMAGTPGADEWAERIARELRPWIVATEGLQQILLLGMETPRSGAALAQASGLRVTVCDPWQGIRDPQGLVSQLEELPASFAAAVGLAKTALSRREGINLLPQQFKIAAQQRRKLAWTYTGLLCALLLLAPLAISGNRTLLARQAEYAKLSRQVQHAQQPFGTPLNPAMAAAQQVVLALHTPAGRPLEVLRLLSAQLPAGITLTDFSYDREKTAVLHGRADSNAVLATAAAVITRTTVFDNVMLNFSSLVKEKDKGQHGYDFEITCTLPAGADPTLGTGKIANRISPRKGTVVQ